MGRENGSLPNEEKGQQSVNNALDLGVALLVKTLSLARVATALSCDGHGDKPARIDLFTRGTFLGGAVYSIPWVFSRPIATGRGNLLTTAICKLRPLEGSMMLR